MKGKARKVVMPLAAAIFMLPAMSEAFEFPYLLKDPLSAMPEVVEKGVVLPGDNSPIPRDFRKDFTQPLALHEAVDMALSSNPKISSAWADIKVQAGSLGESYATYLPTLSAIANWTLDSIHYSSSNYASSDTNRFNVQASLNWRILDFGGRDANRRSADKLLTAALSTYDATIQDSLTSVVQAYFDSMSASALLRAKRENVEIARGTLRSAEEREARGVVSKSDTLRATTELSKALLEQNRAEGDYQKSLAILARYIGLSDSSGINLPSDLDERQVVEEGTKKSLAAWLEDAKKHPAILSAKKQLDAASEQVTVSKSSGLPTLNFSANYYQNTSPGQAVTRVSAQEATLIVGVSIPIFEGFTTTYKVRGAQAKMEKQKAVLTDTEQQVAMNVIKAYSGAESSMKNLDASALLLRSAKEALVVSQRKYDKGAADITELLSTQSALADARNERVRCLADWNSARLQLLSSAGAMGRYAVTQK